MNVLKVLMPKPITCNQLPIEFLDTLIYMQEQKKYSTKNKFIVY